MDKLKQILAQKFWIILFPLVLIMPLVGYFMAKGKLAAAIDERWKKLDGAFTGIPQGTGVPNDSWTQRLNVINEQQVQHNTRANHELWLKQKERMTWPKEIAPIMAKAGYFQNLTEEQKGDQLLYKYPQSYRSQIRALWEIVDPLDDGTNLRDSDKRRKVAFAMADLHQSAKMGTEDYEPSFVEIWNAQEDIWLQTELLHAIRRMNANGISQGDAFIKQVVKIQLFGGTKVTGDEAATTSGGMASGAGGDMAGGMMAGGMMAGGGGFGGAVGTQRTDSSASSADINLGEEFVVSPEGGAGTRSSDMGAFSSNPAGSADANASGGDEGGTPDGKRYIDFVENQPYKRRGFYIKMVMDHRKVPDLLAELMNSQFPVEIIRVHQVMYSDSGNTSGGTGGLMAGGAAGGFGGGFKPSSSADAAGASTLASKGFGESDGSGSGLATARSGAGLGAGLGAGSGAGLGAGLGAGSGAGGSGSAAAMADPNLAHVAILGLWTLYLPPTAVPDAAGQVAPATPAPGLAGTSENLTPSSKTTAETATTDPKPTATESTEGAGDEAKKPDDPDAPKSEPAKSEKADSDSDKPQAEKTPPKTETPDNSESESK